MKRILIVIGVLLGLVAAAAVFVLWGVPNLSYGYARAVSEGEAALRSQVVKSAEGWLGTVEGDSRHRQIIDLYNGHEPLAQGYSVKYEDNWCAAFGSAAAISCDLTDIIPTECGCERQIGLFQNLGCWEEDDNYLPLPGDYIFYAWGDSPVGDCTGWADHVGIVVGTWGPFIKVIEGNKDDAVGYRFLLRNDPSIRGFGLPDYASKIG